MELDQIHSWIGQITRKYWIRSQETYPSISRCNLSVLAQRVTLEQLHGGISRVLFQIKVTKTGLRGGALHYVADNIPPRESTQQMEKGSSIKTIHVSNFQKARYGLPRTAMFVTFDGLLLVWLEWTNVRRCYDYPEESNRLNEST